MSRSKELDPVRRRCAATVWQPETQPWKNMRRDIARLRGGPTDNLLAEEMKDPKSIVVLLRDEQSGGVIGLTWASPAALLEGNMRLDDLFTTASVRVTVLDKEYQGHGLVGDLLGVLDDELKKKGYKFMSRYATTKNGYAANIEKNYEGRIVDKHDDNNGHVYFRIKL